MLECLAKCTKMWIWWVIRAFHNVTRQPVSHNNMFYCWHFHLGYCWLSTHFDILEHSASMDCESEKLRHSCSHFTEHTAILAHFLPNCEQLKVSTCSCTCLMAVSWQLGHIYVCKIYRFLYIYILTLVCGCMYILVNFASAIAVPTWSQFT